MNSIFYCHRDCRKCNSEKMDEIMTDLHEEGLTFTWTATGETRQKKRWFNRGMKTQRKEIKIAMPPESMPHGVYRWKTI